MNGRARRTIIFTEEKLSHPVSLTVFEVSHFVVSLRKLNEVSLSYVKTFYIFIDE